jgi:hypothetical protein
MSLIELWYLLTFDQGNGMKYESTTQEKTTTEEASWTECVLFDPKDVTYLSL